MKVLAYTYNYAQTTTTFMTNELFAVQERHELLLVYSNRLHPSHNVLTRMIEIPFRFNAIVRKVLWLLEKYEIYFSLYNATFRRRVNTVIDDFKPDVIHCHFGTDFLRLRGNLKKANQRIPILVSFYGFDVTERIRNSSVRKRYRQFLAERNVFSIAVSSSLAANINQVLRPANRAKVLHSGINAEFFTRKPGLRDPNEFVFLQVSSFMEKKGHLLTLDAFRRFIDSDSRYKYRMVFAGLGPLKEKILSRIRELALTEEVSLLDAITPAEMVELSSRAGCFIQMSVTARNGDQEGLPNVLLEAMSLELPILSTQHGGIPEIVENGVNGILCKEYDVDGYVRGMKEIAKWRVCPQNREKVIANFSIQSHMKELDEIYSDISGKSADQARQEKDPQ